MPGASPLDRFSETVDNRSGHAPFCSRPQRHATGRLANLTEASSSRIQKPTRRRQNPCNRSFVSHIGPDGREGRFTPFEEVMHSTKPPFEQKSLPSNEKASLRSGSLPSKGSRRPGILVNAKIAQSRWQKRDERTHRGAEKRDERTRRVSRTM